MLRIYSDPLASPASLLPLCSMDLPPWLTWSVHRSPSTVPLFPCPGICWCLPHLLLLSGRACLLLESSMDPQFKESPFVLILLAPNIFKALWSYLVFIILVCVQVRTHKLTWFWIFWLNLNWCFLKVKTQVLSRNLVNSEQFISNTWTPELGPAPYTLDLYTIKAVICHCHARCTSTGGDTAIIDSLCNSPPAIFYCLFDLHECVLILSFDR